MKHFARLNSWLSKMMTLKFLPMMISSEMMMILEMKVMNPSRQESEGSLKRLVS